MRRLEWVVLVAACGASPHLVPRAVLHACHVPGVTEELRCGTLDVPEDRARGDGRHLALPVVVLPAHAGLGRGTPLFSVAGGPGIAATDAAVVYAHDVDLLRDSGDIVLVDQRGTGDGPSALSCPELEQSAEDVLPAADAVRACRDRLAPRADLRFYGTREVVRDIEDARRALGYDRIDLEALSYGTRVAQDYLRAYPEHVRAVVLAGTLAQDVHLPDGFAEAGQHVLDAIVDDCERDAGCREAYPSLRAQLAALARELPPDIDRVAFAEWVRHAIATAAGSRALPSIIARAAAGDFAPFRKARHEGHFREAVLLSVSCSEDQPFVAADARERASKTWFGDGRLVEQAAACAEWQHAPVARSPEPVAFDGPVLVFAGERDSITPPAYARRATRLMSHATVIDVPWLGHMPDGLTHADCLDRIEHAFLLDPAARLDTSCIATITPPPFSIASAR